MTLFRTVEPALEPVTLAEAKAFLRVDHDSEDNLIASLIAAARQDVERTTGAALIDQTWRLSLDDWPQSGTVAVHRYPLRQVLGVTVYDANGDGVEIDPDDYVVDGNSSPPRIHFREAVASGQPMNGIEIDFTAGFGAAGPDVPDSLRRAILVLVAHWYEFRASVGPQDQPVSYPLGYDRLLASWKQRRLV